MSVMRCEEPGWIKVAAYDERRGLWIRVRDWGVEFCAGREGDDLYAEILSVDATSTFVDFVRGLESLMDRKLAMDGDDL